VTLDAGGTLFAVAEPVGRTYARLAARHGLGVAADRLERAFDAAFRATPPLAFPGASPARLADRERAWWHALVRRAFGAAAAHASFDACFAELFAHYGRAAAWRVFPEVPDALAALRARGLRLAVVSNFDGRLPGLLAALGLGALFDAVVYSSRAGAAKPAPAIFAAALAALGEAPDAVVHVGDGVEADVGGARAAGLRAVLVDRAGLRPVAPADVTVIASLAALPALVQQ
jgi:putative hydrolase of the HAD superfamily